MQFYDMVHVELRLWILCTIGSHVEFDDLKIVFKCADLNLPTSQKVFFRPFLPNKWNIEISGIFILKHVYFMQVVAIIEKRNNRACTGNIMLMTDKSRDWAFFRPIDSRMPRMRVPMSECPKGDWKATFKILTNIFFKKQCF